MQKDGPITQRVNPKTKLMQQERGHGALGHFHKDIAPSNRLPVYCERFVKGVQCVQDSGNFVADGPNFFADAHIRIRVDP